MMNIAWKIGVNSQAMVLKGSEPGTAGVSGGAGEWDAPGLPPTPPVPGMQAATMRAIPKASRRGGPIRRRVGGRVTSTRPRWWFR